MADKLLDIGKCVIAKENVGETVVFPTIAGVFAGAGGVVFGSVVVIMFGLNPAVAPALGAACGFGVGGMFAKSSIEDICIK